MKLKTVRSPLLTQCRSSSTLFHLFSKRMSQAGCLCEAEKRMKVHFFVHYPLFRATFEGSSQHRSGKPTWMSYRVNMGVSTSLFPCSRHCSDEESRLIRDVLTVLPLTHSDQACRRGWRYQGELIAPLLLAQQRQVH